MPTSATLKTVERHIVPSNVPTSLTLKTPESIGVTHSEGFEGCQTEHISEGVVETTPIVPRTPAADNFGPAPAMGAAILELSNSSAPGDYGDARWRETLAGMEAFCAQWAGRAGALGWHGEELFSLDPIAPAARHDKRGLALSLCGGARVEAIDSEGADIRTAGGSRLRFYRKARQRRSRKRKPTIKASATRSPMPPLPPMQSKSCRTIGKAGRASPRQP
jgi:hypothetical protein